MSISVSEGASFGTDFSRRRTSRVTHLRDTVAIHLIVKSGERSTPCGCPFFSHVVEGRSPEDPWTGQCKQSRDPARVSHLPVRQSVRHPSGVAGLEPHRNPESSGLRPSTSGLKSGHPCRGASYPTLHYELNDLCKDQMRHLCVLLWCHD